ncbi:MAG: DUF971 domain-containing protein [Deltaproteobacteria bacterium]|nr:DUF971 domain-containing protein [Deltaproteobacteria bacterium]
MHARAATPKEVRRLPEQRSLRIAWSDGHLSEYPWEYLRGWCPCAGCQGHGTERRFIHAPPSDLNGIAVVGNYALCLTWSDGHDTGIYSYRHLRDLCACTQCHSIEA